MAVVVDDDDEVPIWEKSDIMCFIHSSISKMCLSYALSFFSIEVNLYTMTYTGQYNSISIYIHITTTPNNI